MQTSDVDPEQKSRPVIGRARPLLARRANGWVYLAAVVMVFVATWITRHLQPLLGESISPLFFAAVMLSAWMGGLGPGLLATTIAGWASAYFFPNNPPGALIFSWDDGIRLVVFLMVSILISSLTSLHKRAQLALVRANEQLEQRVLQRTGQLLASNQRLGESEQRFRALVEGVRDYALVMLDATGHIISWNSGAGRIEGYTPEEVVGHHVAEFFPPEEGATEAQTHLDYAGHRGRHEAEGWRVRKNGSRFWAHVITTALRDDQDNLRGFAQVTRDITDLRKLERQVLQISETERRRIGHDLHDGLGQELTGLSFLSQGLADRLAARNASEASDMQRLATMILGALEQTRDLAHGFSPVELGPDGLRAALMNLAAKLQSTVGVPCEFVGTGRPLVDDDAALHLYRIAQEALNNAARHAKATQFAIKLEATPQGVVLTIQDNGVGFGLDAERGSGVGISVMQYRASIVGATLEIQSGPAKGTMIRCIYTAQRSPVRADQPDAALMSHAATDGNTKESIRESTAAKAPAVV